MYSVLKRLLIGSPVSSAELDDRNAKPWTEFELSRRNGGTFVPPLMRVKLPDAQLSTMALFSHLSGVEREPAAGVAAPAQSGQAEKFNKYMSAPGARADVRLPGAPVRRVPVPVRPVHEVNKYSLYDVVDKISTPLLTTDPEQDEFFSGRSTIQAI